MSFTVYFAIWAALGVVVIGMAIYRNLLGVHEPVLHVSQSRVSTLAEEEQKREFGREELLERWGPRLTIAVIAYGLILASAYLYHVSQYHAQIPR